MLAIALVWVVDWHALAGWLEDHGQSVQLIAVWIWALSYLIVAAGMLIAWFVLRKTRDQEDLGRALKRQKAALAVLLGTSGAYWGAVLLVYYTDVLISTWTRLVMTALIIGSSIVSVIGVSAFVVALLRGIREDRRVTEPLVSGGGEDGQ